MKEGERREWEREQLSKVNYTDFHGTKLHPAFLALVARICYGHVTLRPDVREGACCRHELTR